MMGRVNELSRSDMSTAIMFTKELVAMGVLKEKELKVIVSRIKDSADVYVMRKYIPKLEALNEAVKGL
jgi:hypothetical protein